MPVTKSAKKKLRQDKEREVTNDVYRNLLKKLLKKARMSKSPKDIIKAISHADKASKKHIIHKNKASRIKASLSHLILPSTQKTQSPKKPIRKKAQSPSTSSL